MSNFLYVGDGISHFCGLPFEAQGKTFEPQGKPLETQGKQA